MVILKHSSILRIRSLLAVLALAGCKPELVGRPSLIDSPRVIAIRSTPAEAEANGDVRYDALVAQPLDDTTTPTFDWALCLASKPLATPGPISNACLTPSGPDLEDLGTSSGADASMPSDVCQLFGPNPPTPKNGEPAVRPVDPDTTGGYYQPVRLLTHYVPSDSEYDVGVTRIGCGVATGASLDQSATYTKNYKPNENPGISQITLTPAGGTSVVIDPTASAGISTVTSGAAINFQVTWPSCPLTPNCGDSICSPGEDLNSCPQDCTTPRGCEGSEPYLSYDPASQTLTNRRESIRVSWFATDGNFNHDRTGRTESEADQTNTSNDWTAPDKTTTVRFWLVIRDDRRGSNWTTFDLQVSK